MSPMTVASGRRIHRLTLNGTGEEVPDGRGGWTTAPSVIAANVYGELMPATARNLERLVAGAVVQTTASHLVVIPYVPGVTEEATVVFHDPLEGDRTFTISGMVDPDERHLELVLACEEVKA